MVISIGAVEGQPSNLISAKKGQLKYIIITNMMRNSGGRKDDLVGNTNSCSPISLRIMLAFTQSYTKGCIID